jgi:hypothetical protein
MAEKLTWYPDGRLPLFRGSCETARAKQHSLLQIDMPAAAILTSLKLQYRALPRAGIKRDQDEPTKMP